MSKALVFAADGSEEIELVATVDVLRRAGIEVDIASINAVPKVTGSHGIEIGTDTTAQRAAADFGAYDAVVIPGGLPGAYNLRDESAVIEALRQAAAAGKIVAAICAGPVVLAQAGLLGGKRFTSYPGFGDPGVEAGGTYSEDIVVRDGQVITARGPMMAVYFALEIIEALEGAAKREEIAAGLLVPLVEGHSS